GTEFVRARELAVVGSCSAAPASAPDFPPDTETTMVVMKTPNKPTAASMPPKRMARPGTPWNALPMGGGNELQRASTKRTAFRMSKAWFRRSSGPRPRLDALCFAGRPGHDAFGPMGSSPLSYACSASEHTSLFNTSPLSDSSAKEG